MFLGSFSISSTVTVDFYDDGELTGGSGSLCSAAKTKESLTQHSPNATTFVLIHKRGGPAEVTWFTLVKPHPQVVSCRVRSQLPSGYLR